MVKRKRSIKKTENNKPFPTISNFIKNHPSTAIFVAGILTLFAFLLLIGFQGIYTDLNEFLKAFAPSFIAAIVVYVMIEVQNISIGLNTKVK